MCCGSACHTATRVLTQSSTTTRRQTSGPGFVEPSTVCSCVCRSSLLAPCLRPTTLRATVSKAPTHSTRSVCHQDHPSPCPLTACDRLMTSLTLTSTRSLLLICCLLSVSSVWLTKKKYNQQVHQRRYEMPPLSARCCHVANDLTTFTSDRRTNRRTGKQTNKDIAIALCHRICERGSTMDSRIQPNSNLMNRTRTSILERTEQN